MLLRTRKSLFLNYKNNQKPKVKLLGNINDFLKETLESDDDTDDWDCEIDFEAIN